MNVEVIRRPLTENASPIDELAGSLVRCAELSSRTPNVALMALIRLADEALARLDGHDSTSQFMARRSRIHAERRSNAERGRR